MHRPTKIRRLLLAAAALYAAFVVYGSLLPFCYQAKPLTEAAAEFRTSMARTSYHTSTSDVAINVLLMVPLAFLLAGAMSYGRGRLATAIALCTTVAVCALLTVSIEFAQLFFPPRTAARSDVIAQLLGAGMGTAAWLLGGGGVTDWLARLGCPKTRPRGSAGLLTAYLVLLLLLQSAPFDFATSPVEIYRKWRAGNINLVPFAMAENTIAMVNDALLEAMYFLPLGILGAMARRDLPARRYWAEMLVLAVAIPLVAETLQVVVLSRVADVTDILAGTCGLIAGWLATAGLVARKPPLAWQWCRALLWTVCCLAWLGVALFLCWHPFDFRFHWHMARQRIAGVSLIPLADYQTATPQDAIQQCAQKTLLFVPLGALLAGAIGRGGRQPLSSRRTALVLAAVLLLAGTLEAGQTLLPSRFPGVTDPLLACLGTALGAWIPAANPPASHMAGTNLFGGSSFSDSG